MIDSVSYIMGNSLNPYHNLALEEYLLGIVKEEECILYLWQNANTVVIGKNQNAWKECKIAEIERDGGHIARRLSGGGAVFHDEGNLNFTFLVRTNNYDLDKQQSVILEAVRKEGIQAEKSGRNDITVEGRKFSGNAFHSSGLFSYHHGTLLVDVDMGKLSRYLNVSLDKLQSKGVTSVKSRVANLKEYRSDLTIARMEQRMIQVFSEVYCATATKLNESRIDEVRVLELEQKYSSWEWRLGNKMAFTYELSHRFDWGDLQLQLRMQDGIVREAVAYSDAMDAPSITNISDALIGVAFSSKNMADAIRRLDRSALDERILKDVEQLIRDQDF